MTRDNAKLAAISDLRIAMQHHAYARSYIACLAYMICVNGMCSAQKYMRLTMPLGS